MSDEFVLYEVEDAVATVTLNRPERMNAIGDDMTLQLWAAMQRACDDDDVRVIVLTGAGRAFCAGGDVGGFGSQDPAYLTTKLPRPFDMNRRADYQTRHALFPSLSKPVIAMINGPVVGLGLVYALFCDIRFAAAEAVFATAFAKIALTAEYGAAWILTRIVGQANALDLLLSSRRVQAEEAMRMGLVNRVVPGAELATETYAYAREMARSCSPRSLRVIKQQIYDVPFQTLAEAVIEANRDMITTNGSADFKEGSAAFREKRTPRFTGR